MKYLAGAALLALVAIAWIGSSAPAAAQAAGAASTKTLDGKELFTSQGCNTCHAMSTAAITAKMKSSKAPDLAQMKAKPDAQALSNYLRQQAPDAGGKKHAKAFTGSDEQLGALLGWIANNQKDKK
jgi:mono/diheme cytochrome c family protein